MRLIFFCLLTWSAWAAAESDDYRCERDPDFTPEFQSSRKQLIASGETPCLDSSDDATEIDVILNKNDLIERFERVSRDLRNAAFDPTSLASTAAYDLLFAAGESIDGVASRTELLKRLYFTERALDHRGIHSLSALNETMPDQFSDRFAGEGAATADHLRASRRRRQMILLIARRERGLRI